GRARAFQRHACDHETLAVGGRQHVELFGALRAPRHDHNGKTGPRYQGAAARARSGLLFGARAGGVVTLYYLLLGFTAVERLVEMIVSVSNAKWSFARGGR